MPTYEVLEKSYINNRIYEAGEMVEYDGLAAGNLKPTDKAGEKKAAEYLASDAARVAQLNDAFKAETAAA